MSLNIVPTAPIDGVQYASSVVLTPSEATLGNTSVPDPIAVIEGQEVVAVVKLAITGLLTGNSVFIFLQTDLNGDGTWIDVAWLFWTGKQGTATFVLCGGGRGAMNNAFQQSRQSGSAPATQANGSNAVPLGGRIRFSGFCNMSGGSSSLSGSAAAVSASITYKLSTPR